MNKKYILTYLLMLFCSLTLAQSTDSTLQINYSPRYLLHYRRLDIDQPIFLYELKDSINARKIRNIAKNLGRLTFDSSNLRRNLDSVYFYAMPYYLNKYGLDSIDSGKMILKTKQIMNNSPYFKDILNRWDNKKILEYIAFRSEYELVREYFPQFKLDAFKRGNAYKNLIERLQRDYISADRADSVLQKITKVDYTPLHFYYKPNSVQEQIIIDKTDVAAVDFTPIVNFYNRNLVWLDSAEYKFGVNKEIIVGILKKETNFGNAPMNYRLFEVLLGQLTMFINNQAALPEEIKSQEKRVQRLMNSAGNSLYHAVKYALRNKLSPDSVKSNVVGAMGFPQFMPFNFSLAQDADGNGRADLNSMPDAIFSIANFFSDKGWKETLKYGKKNRDQFIKYILSYNSNPSYADAVYDIAEELHKIKKGESKLKKPKKKKRHHKVKPKSKKKKHKK